MELIQIQKYVELWHGTGLFHARIWVLSLQKSFLRLSDYFSSMEQIQILELLTVKRLGLTSCIICYQERVENEIISPIFKVMPILLSPLLSMEPIREFRSHKEISRINLSILLPRRVASKVLERL